MRQTVVEMQTFITMTADQGATAALLATAASGALPGLTAALQDQLERPAVIRARSRATAATSASACRWTTT